MMVQPEGNYFVKLKSSNPLVKKLMSNFFKKLFALMDEHIKQVPTTILDAGCGEGDFAGNIHDKYPDAHMEAFDISENVINLAKSEHGEGISFFVSSIDSIPCADARYSLVTCSEVIEHLEDPVKALKELRRVSSEYVVITVPDEPLWRILNVCRFKYLKNFGNTPGHINHYSKRKLLRLIDSVEGYEVVGYKKAIPWQLAVLKKV